ncbi:SH3 domain-containing protein [Chitinimonas naiadis]
MHPPRFSKLIAAALLGLAAASAAALEFRSVAEHGAVFYDAPGSQAKKLFVASKGTPVEVLIDNKEWLRVRDQSGALAWIEKKSLSSKRSVVVTTSKAEVRTAPDAKSALLFMADKSVVFDLIEAGKNGWIKVRHRDGATGYLRIEEVWGV